MAPGNRPPARPGLRILIPAVVCLIAAACGGGGPTLTASSASSSLSATSSSTSSSISSQGNRALPDTDATAATGKGVNYRTGYGIQSLIANEQNLGQVALDFQQIGSLEAQWVRVETYMPQNGVDATIDLPNFIDAIEAAGMQPVLDILQWHYPASIRPSYQRWLKGLLNGAAHNVAVFELGNEPNLNTYGDFGGTYDAQTGQYTQPYPGFDVEDQPYGWDIPEYLVDTGSTDPNEYLGACPSGDMSAYQAAVAEYVQFLSDSYQIIKEVKPNATVVVGGISSWQATCFLQMLGALKAYLYADAIGWHPYPVGSMDDPPPYQTPQRGADSIAILTQAMSTWPRQLPIWITEYGFQSPNNGATYDNGDGAAVENEAIKGQYLVDQYQLMRSQMQISGPIMMWTATDEALTATDWANQDSSGSEGGWGLFEYCYPDQSSNSCPSGPALKVNPAFDLFKALN